MITRTGDLIRVTGDVTMATASALFREGLKSPSPENSNMVVDFSQLEKMDSSAVSLMLVWMREAERSKVNLRFEKVPDNLISLARLYGVADLLPLKIAE